ncbi:Bromodomain-containing protein 3 [Balamuthia mandrillaris]
MSNSLHALAEDGSNVTALLGLLQNKSVDVNGLDEYGETALHYACTAGNNDCTKVLIQKGANVNAENSNGITPLHHAARLGRQRCVAMLLKHNANVNAKDHHQWTPLHYACFNARLEVAEALIKQGADVHARNNDGCTPLHLAADAGALDCITLLIRYGAVLNALDSNGNTPLSLLTLSEDKKTAGGLRTSDDILSANHFLQELGCNLLTLLNNETYSDVIFLIPEEEEEEENEEDEPSSMQEEDSLSLSQSQFKALRKSRNRNSTKNFKSRIYGHKAILFSRSDYWKERIEAHERRGKVDSKKLQQQPTTSSSIEQQDNTNLMVKAEEDSSLFNEDTNDIDESSLFVISQNGAQGPHVEEIVRETDHFTFMKYLEFIYTGNVRNLEELSTEKSTKVTKKSLISLLHLLELSKVYHCPAIQNFCEFRMTQEGFITAENVIEFHEILEQRIKQIDDEQASKAAEKEIENKIKTINKENPLLNSSSSLSSSVSEKQNSSRKKEERDEEEENVSEQILTFLQRLKGYCGEFMIKNFNDILETDALERLQKETLIEIVHNLQVEQKQPATYVKRLGETLEESREAMDPKTVQACKKIVRECMALEISWPFNQPVDPVALNIPDYFTIIKHPMDLSTVKNKLQTGSYATINDFASDVRLIFSNAVTYNEPGTWIFNAARELRKLFDTKLQKLRDASLRRRPMGTATDIRGEPELSLSSPKLGSGGTTATVDEDDEADEDFTPQSGAKRRSSVAGTNAATSRAKNGRAVGAAAKTTKRPTKLQEKEMSEASREERFTLGQNINLLDGEQLLRVVEIINENGKKVGSTSEGEGEEEEDIEIDLHDLPNSTLRKLQEYVDSCLEEKRSRQEKEKQQAQPQNKKKQQQTSSSNVDTNASASTSPTAKQPKTASSKSRKRSSSSTPVTTISVVPGEENGEEGTQVGKKHRKHSSSRREKKEKKDKKEKKKRKRERRHSSEGGTEDGSEKKKRRRDKSSSSADSTSAAPTSNAAAEKRPLTITMKAAGGGNFVASEKKPTIILPPRVVTQEE